jgi:DNA-binding IclR family transcriptional regulator
VSDGHLDGPTGDASAHGKRRRAHPDERGVIRSAFHLLDLVADLEPVRLVDLALVAGIPRPTVHRLLGQLVAVGAVRREGTRYRLGQSLLGLGTRVSPERQLRVAARRPIAELAAASGATVSLSGALGGDLVYLDTVDARVPFGYIFEPGSQVPQGTAQARAHTEIPHVGPLAAIVDEGRVVPDLSCVAAPIPLPTGGVAAIAAVVAGRRPPAALLGATRATAARIAGLLNDQPDLGAAKSSLDGLSGRLRSGRFLPSEHMTAAAFDVARQGPGDGRIPPAELAWSHRAAYRFDQGVPRFLHLEAR